MEQVADSDEINDDELAALAMAADPDAAIDADAVPFGIGPMAPALLPAWYMPVPTAGSVGRGRRLVIGGIIAALVLVNAAGLCVTYGFPEIAW